MRHGLDHLPTAGSSLAWVFGIVIGILAIEASAAGAAVTFDSQRRDVNTFAVVSFPEGEDPFCTDGRTSLETGVFAETVDCLVEEAGSHATALAGQLSYITPQLYLAEGSFQAEAMITGDVDFAEGLGASRFVSEFSVDTPTGIHLTAMLHTGGNGATNLVFRVTGGEIFVYRSILGDDSDEVDEWFTLEPGSYELTFTTSGYGQALPDGSGNPASGSFSGSIEFPTVDVTTPESSIVQQQPTLVAAPNPLRDATKLLFAGSAQPGGGEILVSDLTGRLVRRFHDVGPAGVTWDARDGNGRPVAAGIYLARRANVGTATRLIVLR